jgi:HAD superfamily hydrolase (TIGR01509 family)
MRRLSDLKAVVFDLDGTLFDSVDAHIESWIIAFRLAGFGNIPYEIVKPLVGLSGKDIVKKILGSEGMGRYSKIRWFKDRVFWQMVKEGKAGLYPGVKKLLKLLRHRGYRLAIASSTPNHMLLPITDALEITNYFNVLVGGDEVKRGKPEPDIFIKAFSRLGVNPPEGIIVGDTAYDILPAKKIGALAVLVNSSLSDMNLKPDIELEWIYELIDLFLH